MSTIRIVIPTYNSERTIEKCLKAVYSSDYKDFEVVVVDDGSTDNTVKLANKFPCKLIKSTVNKGPAHVRNVGAKNCNKNYLLFIDSDVIIKEDTISKLITRVQKEKVEAVIGSYTTIPINPSKYSIYHNLFQYYYYFLRTAQQSKITTLFWTGCGLVETKAFNQIGGFREEDKYKSSEDDMLGYDLTNNRNEIYIDIDITVYHDHYYNFKSLLRNYFVRAEGTAQTIFKSENKLEGHGYFNLSNWIGLIFSFLFISTLPFTVFSFIFLVVFLLANYKFYLLVFKETNTFFAIFSIIINYICYISTGLGAFVGLLR